MDAVLTFAPTIGVSPVCRALGMARASFYRQAHPDPRVPAPSPVITPRRVSARALDSAERQAILAVLHAPRFQDCSPTEVDATLLDEGVYLASERTFYRLLAAVGETRSRDLEHMIAIKDM